MWRRRRRKNGVDDGKENAGKNLMGES
jgi:hypothetical protein